MLVSYQKKYKIRIFKGTIRELRMALFVARRYDIPLACLSK